MYTRPAKQLTSFLLSSLQKYGKQCAQQQDEKWDAEMVKERALWMNKVKEAEEKGFTLGMAKDSKYDYDLGFKAGEEKGRNDAVDYIREHGEDTDYSLEMFESARKLSVKEK